MNDLTTFLSARLDEIQARALEQHALYCGTPPESGDCDCALPVGYVLADLTAKRQLVEMYRRASEDFTHITETVAEYERRSALEDAVGLLARPFDSHDDFDPGWRL